MNIFLFIKHFPKALIPGQCSPHTLFCSFVSLFQSLVVTILLTCTPQPFTELLMFAFWCCGFKCEASHGTDKETTCT